MKCHCTPVRMAKIKDADNVKCWWGEDVEKLELLYTADGNAKYSHSEK